MKAITIMQPWASLLAVEKKLYETRSWATKYRGEIAIHAGKTKPSEVLKFADAEVIFAVGRAFGIEPNVQKIFRFLDNRLPRGSVVATGVLTDCYKMSDDVGKLPDGSILICAMNDFSRDECLFGNWIPGNYAWAIDKTQMIFPPIPAKGQQGLWNWEDKQ
jgi:hypothetical protein